MELGYHQANRNQAAYDDGWFRTFRGVPEIAGEVRKMIDEYLAKQDYSSIVLFFTKTCRFAEDYSEFLLRELLKGRL